ncbi:MAG: SpoIID/LytB domain-containing protein [Marinilabiliaceae bacterium]|nr:SpoIID/LytB domain-containing protein [Marinilabiliaceae bacterium]
MLLRISVVLICVFTSFFLHAQQPVQYESLPEYSSHTITYEGRVLTISGKTPLSDVEISVENFGKVGVTNSAGCFRVIAPVNVSKLIFRKEGFISASRVYIEEHERSDCGDIWMIPFDGEVSELVEPSVIFIDSISQLVPEALFVKETSLLKAVSATSVPQNIKVLMPSGSVVEMSMDEYLKGVVPSEVHASWPMDALMAQAVAARCYAAANFKHAADGADVCTTTHCQAWSATQHERSSQAVTQTSGVSVKYAGTIANTLFFSHCNGRTRNNEDVWSGAAVPYLRSQACGCGYTYHNAHGVGMCQYGALAMADAGRSWEEIILHYYKGVTIDKSVALGTIKGVIYHGTDASNLNNRIAGATVTATGGSQVTTDANGLYVLNLAPGTYTITATKSGYANASLIRQVEVGTTVWGSMQLTASTGVTDSSAPKSLIDFDPEQYLLTVSVPGRAQMYVSDLTGRIWCMRSVYDKTTEDLSSYPSGVYLVTVVGNTFRESMKIVK